MQEEKIFREIEGIFKWMEKKKELDIEEKKKK